MCFLAFFFRAWYTNYTNGNTNYQNDRKDVDKDGSDR